jgi:hypothetical protein
MAIFRISPFNSIFTSAINGVGFASGTFGADSLVIDPGAFIWSTGIDSTLVWLNAPGNWTVTVNGMIRADGNISIALEIGPGIPGVSSVTVGAVGGIISSSIGILAESPVNVKNSGVISSASSSGIWFNNAGANSVTNSGTIDGIENYNTGRATITNSGTIDSIGNINTGDMVVKNSGTIGDIGGFDSNTTIVTNTGTIASVTAVTSLTNSKTITDTASADKLINSGAIGGNVTTVTLTNKGEIGGDVSGAVITNSKTIAGDVTLSNDANKLTNSGVIGGDVRGDGNDTITNTKTIAGSVSLFDGTNTLTNSGTISANVTAGTIFDPDSINTIVNSKTIGGSLTFSSGTNSLKNSGTIGGDVAAFGDSDTITNTKTITGSVSLSSGTNMLTNSGTIGADIIVGMVFDPDRISTIVNSKTIGGSITFNDGTNSLKNSGTIGGDVVASSGNDTFVNSKTIGGAVNFGSGQDVLTNSGTIAHDVTFGVGADSIKNTGTILGAIVAGGDLTLTGAGKIKSVNEGAEIIGSDGHSIAITNDGNSISGDGVVGDSHVDFVNAKGSIIADVSGHELWIQAHTFSNGGLLEALHGGWLLIGTDVTNTAASAKIATSGAGSIVQLDGSVNGGTISVAKGTDFEILHGVISGAKITNAGNFSAFGDVTVTGGIANTGALQAEDHHLIIQGAVTGKGSALISGSGILEFGAASSANVIFTDGATGSLVFDTATSKANKFTGTISGFDHGDDIQLVGLFDADTATVSQSFVKATGGTVTVMDAQSHGITLQFAGDYTHETFTIQDDLNHPGHIDLLLS